MQCKLTARRRASCPGFKLAYEPIMHQPTNSTISQHPRSRNATTYQTSAKSNSQRRSYCDLNMSNLCAIRHLISDRKWIFTISQPPGINNAPACQISTLSQDLSRYVTSYPGQLSLAILSWVGAMSNSQRAVMPCGWGVRQV